jgi:hypothetical protein
MVRSGGIGRNENSRDKILHVHSHQHVIYSWTYSIPQVRHLQSQLNTRWWCVRTFEQHRLSVEDDLVTLHL